MKPIRRILIIFLSSFVLAQLLFMVLDEGVQKFNAITNEKLNEMFVKNEPYQLITLGSSRSLSHINPCVLDSVLNIKTYSAAMAGANIWEIKTDFLGYLAAHTVSPQYVLVNIDRRTLSDEKKYYNTRLYFPFLHKNKVVDSMLAEIGTHTFWYKYLPFTQMLEYDDYMRHVALQAYLGKNEKDAENTYCKGFMSIPYSKTVNPQAVPDTTNNLVTKEGIGTLVTILNICQTKKIKPIFIFAPESIVAKNNQLPPNPSFQTVDSLAKIYQATILRYDNQPEKYPISAFGDVGHLNGKYAHTLSVQVAEDLAKIMKNE